MEIIDKRKVDTDGEARTREPEKKYDSFRPTLAGFVPDNDCILLRELVLPEEGMIQRPDAYAEDCLFAEVICGGLVATVDGLDDSSLINGCIVRILKGVGHTIPFADVEHGQRYFTVHRQDIIGHWSAQ